MHAHLFIIFLNLNKPYQSCTVQPISIIIYHKFITPLAISTLRNFSLSQIQNRQPTLAQPNFHTLLIFFKGFSPLQSQKWSVLSDTVLHLHFTVTDSDTIIIRFFGVKR